MVENRNASDIHLRRIVEYDVERRKHLEEHVDAFFDRFKWLPEAGALMSSTPERLPRTILVVDDDYGVAEVAAEILESAGFEVRLAYRAQGALDLLRRGEKVDLVFSDIVMCDGMNGIEMAAEITRLRPELPVLLATGYSNSLAQGEAQGLPILAKPYRADDLCNRVEAMLLAAEAHGRTLGNLAATETLAQHMG